SLGATQGSCSGTTSPRCALGTLDPGAAATVTLVVAAIIPSTVTLAVTVSADEPDVDPGDEAATRTTTVAAAPHTAYVHLARQGFSLPAVSLAAGSTAQWNVFDPNGVAAAASGLRLFSFGATGPVGAFRYPYGPAGASAVAHALGPRMPAYVNVGVSPRAGTPARRFVVTVAAETAPAGFVYDVQIRRPGAAFAAWRIGGAAPQLAFVADA